MAKVCYNSIQLDGHPQDLLACFNRILNTTENFLVTDDDYTTPVIGLIQEALVEMEDDMEELRACYSDDEMVGICFTFETAYEPPFRWLEAFAGFFPLLSVDMEYEHETGAFTGRIVYHQGEFVKNKLYDNVESLMVAEHQDFGRAFNLMAESLKAEQNVSNQALQTLAMQTLQGLLRSGNLPLATLNQALQEYWTSLPV